MEEIKTLRREGQTDREFSLLLALLLEDLTSCHIFIFFSPGASALIVDIEVLVLAMRRMGQV